MSQDFDEQTFRALVEPLDRELHAYAYRMLGGFHDADDALQESRLKAWRARATYEPRASLREWMYGIVTNTCLDLLKACARRVMPQDVGPAVAPGPPAPAPRHAEVVDRFVRAWESGDFDDFVELLAADAVMSMPPWEYWLDGKDAVVATTRSPGTWDGAPRPGRYRIVPAPMNGEPGG